MRDSYVPQWTVIRLSAAVFLLLTITRQAPGVPRTWDANGANPANGTFGVAANWNPDGIPVAGDTTTFNINGTYTVTYAASAASDSATVSAGIVDWRSNSGAPRAYALTTGAADLTVQNASTLNIGAPGLPVAVAVGDATTIGTTSGFFAPTTVNVSGFNSSLTTNTLALGPGVSDNIGRIFVLNGASLNVNSGTTFTAGAVTIDSGGQASLGTVTGGSQGNITLNSGSLSYLGNLTVGAGGLLGSTLTLSTGRHLTLNGITNVTSTLNVSGGSLTTGGLSTSGGGTVNFTSGTINITSFGLTIGAGGPFGSEYSLGPNRTINVTGTTFIDSGSSISLDGGTLSTGTLSTSSFNSFIFNSGTLAVTQNGAFFGPVVTNTPNATINVEANNVALGSNGDPKGFHHLGTLNVGFNTVGLYSAGYARLGILTTLNSGTIQAFNGIAMPSGSTFVGNGVIQGRIAGEVGALIDLNGSSAFGDQFSPAGFNFGGELRVHEHSVTLYSSAQAGLGNLTTLSGTTIPGYLYATNGVVVDFNEAITGHGSIVSDNTLAKRTIINGLAQGISPSFPIYFGGYVKGVGTFDNVSFFGTFAPGLSTTTLSAGNMAFADGSTLLMELGGTTPGSGYDQIQSSGTLSLDGVLEVSLINAFTPTVGNTFEILTFASRTGTFDEISGDFYFGNGVFLDDVYSATNLSLVMTQAGPGDADLDGDVDIDDLTILAANYGAAGDLDWIQADFNHDTDVSLIDLTLLATYYSGGSEQAFADFALLTSVPEPHTLLAMLTVLTHNGCCRIFRRR